MSRSGSSSPRREAPSGAAAPSRWRGRLLKLLLGWSLLSAAQAGLLRVISPPITLTMLEKSGVSWKHEPLGSEVPELARAMAVAAEDTAFWRHHGFDRSSLKVRAKQCFRRVERRRARGGGLSLEGCRGASTLSQQTARNVFLLQAGGPLRKVLEAWYTVWLELLVPKERILEVYLDVAQLAPNAYGVEAGARRWFQRPAKDLSPRQMAELLSLLPCPNTCTPESPLPRSLQPKILANWRAMKGKRGKR